MPDYGKTGSVAVVETVHHTPRIAEALQTVRVIFSPSIHLIYLSLKRGYSTRYAEKPDKIENIVLSPFLLMECFLTQMSIVPLFALPSGIEITACSHQEGGLCVSLLSTQPSSPCPFCGTAATRIHSHYQRRLADLPITGQAVRFQLSVRKFFCDESTCPRKIFTERLAPFVAPRARVTARLFQMVQIIGLASGGRLGVRVTDRMGIQTSRFTILRRIMALPTEPVGHVTHIGTDDFSFRRWRKF